jgi:hypothetical protein
VNFNSDPDGATVVRSDGVVLGTTPLSADVPYRNSTIEYVIRLDGYLPKTTSIVPNIASPVFAALQPDDPRPSPDPTSPAADSQLAEPAAIAAPPASAWSRAAAHRARHHQKIQLARAALRDDADRDGVLDPSYR